MLILKPRLEASVTRLAIAGHFSSAGLYFHHAGSRRLLGVGMGMRSWPIELYSTAREEAFLVTPLEKHSTLHNT
jgi:hypothetical protein